VPFFGTFVKARTVESELEKLSRKYRGKLVEVLDPGKKKKFKKLLGDPDLICVNKVKF
jgi:hypothetical protein